jgi:hypothetical protein
VQVQERVTAEKHLDARQYCVEEKTFFAIGIRMRTHPRKSDKNDTRAPLLH